VSPQRRPTGGSRGGRRGEFGRRYTPRRKVCAFCVDKISYIDYKDVPRLRRYLSERGKIEPRRKTGNCARHQRALAVALKRARHVALLPYTAEHIRLSGMVMRSPDDRRRDFDRGPRGPVAAVATGDGLPRAAEAAQPVDGTPVDGTPEEAPVTPGAADAPVDAEAAAAEPPAGAAPAAPVEEAEPVAAGATEDSQPVTAGE
jgi:ribosomal protein S18